jgi:hypothetical protein
MLKSLKPDLKNWNEEVFGDIGRKKKKRVVGRYTGDGCFG